MARSDANPRIVIAVTERSPLAKLWRAAVDAARETPGELVAVFIGDEHWQRIASLPFTREIPKLGGGSADFTAQRAEQLLAETAARVKEQIDKLAAETGHPIAFETLKSADPEQAKRLFGTGRHLCITSSSLTEHPLYTELTRLELDIRIIDRDGED